MKKILFRKILLDCLKFFLLTILGVSTIVWVFQAVNYLDIMVEDGRNYLVYFNYTILIFPKIISKIYPFALFLSFYYVLSKYEKNNELLIFWNHGISQLQIINFFLKASFALMIIQILLLTFLVPKTQDMARSILRNSNINFYDNFLKPKKFNDVIKNVTMYTEKKKSDGSLENIYIKKFSNVNEFEILLARTGVIKNKNNKQVLTLFNGQNIKSKNNNIDSFTFSEFDFNLSSLQSNTTTYKKTQENSSISLISCFRNLNSDDKKNNQILKIENCSIQNLSGISQELYKRMIIPLYIPTLVLAVLILIIISRGNLNYLKLKSLIFLLGIFIIVFSEMSLRFIVEDLNINLKIILIPIMTLIIFYSILRYILNFNLKKVDLK
ncbi:LptF/LptG family permease [Pelagibacterales bacterium SAG-MED08]|jgi:lipopolysaccharide export system permease protein|nr:LptF/LptG family permease [Pelagibacterales bacterium SAG-MED08]|tara:strand:+ start:1011 stop:2156 length:1146 start_codon:yes stop_codon:yes gene_type:complete